ncbi:MAG: hypothetical protein KDA22_01310 [Phycisphaerales bacterium]|nr:hypothetical protein [Phycisphaerales bacterium]
MTDPLEPLDPFTLLGLPHKFDLSRAEIQAAHLRHLARLHPDRIADPIERIEASMAAARVNQARAILENDEHRANELLVRLGGAEREEDRTLPDGFLAEMMETRERIETLMQSDGGQARTEIEGWAAAERRGYLERLRRVLQEAAGVEGDRRTALLAEGRQQLNAWRYIERLLEQLGDAERSSPRETP